MKGSKEKLIAPQYHTNMYMYILILLTSSIFNVCLLLLHGVQVSGQRSIAIGEEDVSLSNTTSENLHTNDGESDNEVLLSMLSIEYCPVNLCQI